MLHNVDTQSLVAYKVHVSQCSIAFKGNCRRRNTRDLCTPGWLHAAPFAPPLYPTSTYIIHQLLYHYYYIAILLPYCPPRSPPCNLTSDTPPPSRPRGRDILPSHPQVPLSSLTFQGRYIPLSSLSSLSFQSRNIPPSSLSLQGRDIPLSLPPATFQEGTLITDGSDRFLGGTR